MMSVNEVTRSSTSLVQHCSFLKTRRKTERLFNQNIHSKYLNTHIYIYFQYIPVFISKVTHLRLLTFDL